ncbi:MAG: hypothetical protein HKN57_07310 [Xanthomonadales bacterium]|nr:hypothetical protein [Xanthomonadales bacterium]
MKNHLGIKVITFISLLLFAWSGCIFAEPPDPMTKMAWGGQDTGFKLWTVDDTKGGHLEVGDTFAIERLTADDKNIYLQPAPKLWEGVNGKVNLTREKPKGKPEFLCGFVELDTDEHQVVSENDRKYGHGKWHGFLVKIQGADSIKIIWSALPLKSQAANSGKCSKLEEAFHGGWSHASG